MHRQRLDIALGARSYPIHIGPGLLGDGALLRARVPGNQALIVTNDVVAPLYLDRLQAALAGLQVATLILPDGERYKDLTTWRRILDTLLERRFARDCALFALGGGVIGDLTGFAAACYQRGVAFVQVPTTLLAQVDSSVGGKTGVNHPAGKNMIGAFHQPVAVIADTDTLATLPARELAAGCAEVIKYGLIRDADFCTWLEQHAAALRAREPAVLTEAIARSCRHKAAVVEADECESGPRALLNLGHTFGHAIEAGMGYGAWLHGEAVAAGMVIAATLAQRLGWLTADELERIRRLLAAFDLPLAPPAALSAERLLELMAIDKKVQRGTLRLVLPRGIGAAEIVGDVPPALIRESIDAARH